MAIRLAAAALSSLALVVCLGGPPAHGAASNSPREKPPGTSSMRLQWHACDRALAAWECGTLTVPRDWFDASNPDTFGIQFAVHRASDRRSGTLTLNPGGPGGASLRIADALMASVPARIKRRFDIVLWDPRGVGKSGPFLTGCPAPPEPPVLPATGPVDWRGFASQHLAASAAANAACMEANSALAPYLGTQYFVRDLEALRQALDVRRWTFWGMSYGTRIGLLYAQLYPSRIRALLLDGSVEPNSSIGQISAGMGAGHAQTVAVLASLLSKRTAARMYRVIRALDHRAYRDDIGGEVTRWEFLFGLLQLSRDQTALPDITRLVNEAFNALFRPPSQRRSVVSAAEFDYGRLYTLRFVNCADYADQPTADDVGMWAASSAKIGTPLAGELTTVFAGYCAGLPAFAHPMPPVTRSISLPHGVVVLNASGDPATPWAWARTMATYFRGSSLISYTGTAHVLYGATPSRCVNRAVTAYLVSLRRPGDITCAFVPGA